MRKFILALIMLFGVMFIIGRLADIEAVIETLQRGDWRFLILAILVETAWLVNVAASLRAIYRGLGVEERIENLFAIAAAANLVNIVTPSAGIGGMAIFITEAKRKNYPTARATVAGALYILYDYVGFLCVLGIGLIILIRRDNLNMPEIIASVILVLLSIIIAIVLYLGTHSSNMLGHILAWSVRKINRVLRPFIRNDYLSEQRSLEFANDVKEGLQELRRTPVNFLLPVALALSNKALLISIFFLVFLAFKVPVSVGTLIAGFCISNLFSVVSPTPSGVGIVEGILTLALNSFYIPLSAAAVIVIAYRGVTFWFPLLVGMMSLRWIGKLKN